jgi:hypothetical protein
MLEDRIKKLARLFGIPVRQELHRALEVGEEDRDLLALTLQGGLGGKDLLGEVLGGVGPRGSKAGLRCPSVDGARALGAELTSR